MVTTNKGRYKKNKEFFNKIFPNYLVMVVIARLAVYLNVTQLSMIFKKRRQHL